MRALWGKAQIALVAGAFVLLAAGAFGVGHLAADPGHSAEPGERSPQSSGTAPALSSADAAGAANRGSPVSVAAPGAELARLTSPPEESLWAFAAGTYQPGVRVAVEFEPYGIGPSSFGESIVALVSSAELEDASVKAPELEGRNVVLIVGDSAVDSGGRYRGVAVTRAEEDRLVLVLEDVEPVRSE